MDEFDRVLLLLIFDDINIVAISCIHEKTIDLFLVFVNDLLNMLLLQIDFALKNVCFFQDLVD